ncbi:2-succinyl-5-enolpyruvyl-6-hydroxy-3-cyclohexene-1-carboxylic-acid synthase [Endozoicomonas sp. OPT23]|uniref:2-succinyl-5-enolpyruvyl-6-hydroxy-3- cyclohexene-1-carboxylic-acid synthase n=1 Tax=Endozoicomonas sp. OPT23 TaxID=2072845 RepID=UPI00129AB4DD|nr:2-succinyl-5-enolpyruvyl-6-hydroxy-3-cyclohexene-1-carboxylic-acid synthase [Endozoicomonas sp. OPT23]MRI34730.1 2-succinyl-5-enolpyruvyl-6-hydroxy-3-cyclohexene-1-carboxylic-acid synthase [Endozoicomonas sp. OPT23]
MTFPIRHHNRNTLWANLLLEELWRLGVRDLCIAPGSRSAPLTLAAADMEKYRKHVHFDERGLAFFALGLAKGSGRAVAVITTSGSAVANLYPALVEAKQFGVPLILITADRPTELVGCGANQAIQQHEIFADYPAASIYWPAPDENISANWLLGSIDQAYARSCDKRLPLHINCMFREPFYPDGELQDFGGWVGKTGHWNKSDKPYTEYFESNEPSWSFSEKDVSEFVQSDGLLVVGKLPESTDSCVIATKLIALSERLGWPIVADVQSPLHGHEKTLKYADLMLVTSEGSRLLAEADRVIQVGSHIVSKRLNALLANNEWQSYWLLSDEQRWLDPSQVTSARFIAPVLKGITELVGSLSGYSRSNDSSVKQDRLKELSESAGGVVAGYTEQHDDLTEVWLGHKLTQILPSSTNLFVGNSLPVRLLDMFSGSQVGRVFSNRGASGIDGLLATAAGCATGSEESLLAIVGDLSFLHDLNSMQLLAKVETPLVVVMVNNDGGGIFSLLPVEKTGDAAGKYFQTPHGLDARHAAEMFGVRYSNPLNRSEFTKQCLKAFDINGCTLIEVTTQPGQAAEQIKQVVSLLKESL